MLVLFRTKNKTDLHIFTEKLGYTTPTYDIIIHFSLDIWPILCIADNWHLREFGREAIVLFEKVKHVKMG